MAFKSQPWQVKASVFNFPVAVKSQPWQAKASAHADRQESFPHTCKQAGKLPSHMHGTLLLKDLLMNRTACVAPRQSLFLTPPLPEGAPSCATPALTGKPVRSTAWLSCWHVRACGCILCVLPCVCMHCVPEPAGAQRAPQSTLHPFTNPPQWLRYRAAL